MHYPINNYDVALNIGNYEHFSDKLGDLTLDFYVLPEDLEKAKKQFAQAKGMLEAYRALFRRISVREGWLQADRSALLRHGAPERGRRYGNHFKNGYLGRDWTGVGISPKFDFIIIHESGHEWFGNSVTAADRSDMWIHEGWTTYLEVPVRGVHVGARRRAEIRERLQIARCRIASRSSPSAASTATPPQDHVLQRRADAEHAAQRDQRRYKVVGAAARFLPALQVSEHHDRRRGDVFQRSRPACT